MKLPLISAGEFFELMRPAAFILSALLSILVLASTQRREFRLYLGLIWALGTYLLPFAVLPIYLLVRYRVKRRDELGQKNSSAADEESQITGRALPAEAPGHRSQRPLLVFTTYSLLLLGATGVYLYQDYNSVDAHLARATQAQLSSQPAKSILEYRAALSREDNPHTHKLLGIELAETRQWAEALKEFRLAESGGEPDELLPFRIAQALIASGDHVGSMIEYKRFFASHACTQELPDDRCETARLRSVERKPN